ncbi:NAD(P)/FAD-dependent oxidoreductase [Cryptosporangium minutisporangium]|uniref:FAD-dependent oxidoreductase n=1 Tax=Cryptosporangium minutisporangium TaxID=113569 RepID=A0ABP6T0R4_9ACTN
MSLPFVVVGASLAGLRAVEAARNGGYEGPITLIGAEPHLPYDRPPLSKAFLEPGAEAVVFREEQHLREDLGVDLRLGAPATRLDPAGHTVTVDGQTLGYRALLIATGSTPLPLPGAPALTGVHTLRTVDDARAIRDALHAGARVVVVGAGFIGSEIASAARRYQNAVTIVEAAPVPLVRAAGPVVGAALARLHQRAGTDVRLGTSVTGLHGRDRVEAVVLSDGTVLDADLVVVGIGSRPATGWLAGSGVALDARDGGVRCDEYLATSAPDVYAAGDVAHWPNHLLDVPMMRLENWTGAAEQGAAATRNALGLGERTPYATAPYVWSDWYDHRIQFVGHPAEDEVRIVLGDLDGPRFVALYRSGERIAGAVTLNEPGKVMKYRRLIARRADWQAALDLYPALTG